MESLSKSSGFKFGFIHFLRLIRAVIRIIGLVILVVFAVFAGLLSPLLPSVYFFLALRWHSLVTALVGVKCRFYGEPLKPGSLIVCNHISWVDISVIGSKYPVVFLAKSVVSQWPVLGWVVRSAGTLFIDRGKGAVAALKEISQTLQEGRSVVLFPEGRTTEGLSVIKFQPRLLQSAVDSGKDMQTAAIRYVDAAGSPVQRISYANTNLVTSLWRTVSGPRIYAEIMLFAPVSSEIGRNQLGQDAYLAAKSWVENH